MTDLVATAPGKLILTGEYAVLTGAPALVLAVNRRVVARVDPARAQGSPFLAALTAELATRFGDDDAATRASRELLVDSSALYADTHKLGLGSSAAVTVAATARALAARRPGEPLDRDLVLVIALAAHAGAQGAQGARGSGADIASAVHGGLIVFTPPDPRDPAAASATLPRVTARRWPAELVLLPFFTGIAADTVTLVTRVEQARSARPPVVEAALAGIASASQAAAQALVAPPALVASALLGALRLAGAAIGRLALVTHVDLVPACVTAARAALVELGGTAKTTGAGGGDVGIAVIPATADATRAHALLIECGCQPIALTVDETGVDLQPDAQ